MKPIRVGLAMHGLLAKYIDLVVKDLLVNNALNSLINLNIFYIIFNH